MYACSIWGIDCNICCCRLRHCRNFCCEVKACKCELHPCSWVESYIHSNCRIIYCCKTCSSLKSSLGFFCVSNKPCCSWHICGEICFVCDAKWKVKCALLLLQLLLPLLNCTWILVPLEVMLYDYKWTIHGRRPRHADVIGDRILCDQILPNQLFYLILHNLILLWVRMMMLSVRQTITWDEINMVFLSPILLLLELYLIIVFFFFWKETWKRFY